MKAPIHESVTQSRVMQAVENYRTTLDNPGICLGCGADQEGCEPDARRYKCEVCERKLVFGAEEILLMEYFHSDK